MAGTTISPTSGSANTSTLSEWAGPYVTDMLAKGQALSNTPYQTYGGPLTAGASDLQNKTFQGLGSLAVPGSIGAAATTAGNVAGNLAGMSYSPTTVGNQYQAPGAYQPVGSAFDAAAANTYMNPYLQASLDPQLKELQRQSQISNTTNAGKLTQAGAFGGSRQAVLQGEENRNLLDKSQNLISSGYNTAFGQAQQQFNADQQRKIQEAQYAASQGMTAAQLQAQYGVSADQANEMSKQFGANYGLNAQNAALAAAQTQGQLGSTQNQTNLSNLNAQLAGGATQRGIESEGVAADLNEFNAQRDYPQKQVSYLNSLIQGLPISTVSNVPQAQTATQQFTGGLTDVTQLLKDLKVIT